MTLLDTLTDAAARHFRIGAYHWLWRGRAVVGDVFHHADEDLLDAESAELVAAGLLVHVGEQVWHSRHASGTYAVLAPTHRGTAAMAALIAADMLTHNRVGDLDEWERAVRANDFSHLPTRHRAERLARSTR
jgi:hypothetical protein